VGGAGTVSISQIGPVYDSTINPLPGNMPSEPFEATQTSQFGNEINLANTSGPLKSVVVTMSSWTCGNWATGSSPCTTTPGTTYPLSITFTIYKDAGSGVVGSVIATDTQMFNILYRPSADTANCGAGSSEWYDNATIAAEFGVTADDTCHNGLANNITFDFSSQNITLPSTVIYGIAFNTTDYGVSPTHVPSPQDSLNVALSTTPVYPTVGTDTHPGELDLSSVTAGWYCDDGAGGTGTFRLDSPAEPPGGCPLASQAGWSLVGGGAPYYLPAVQFNAVSPTTGLLYPGGPAQPINFSVTANTADSYVNMVTVSIPSVSLGGNTVVTSDGTTGIPGCLLTWFTLSGNPATVHHEVDLGTPYNDTSTGMTIQLMNYPTDQSACENASVYLAFTSN
jgi:hypothetical protein